MVYNRSKDYGFYGSDRYNEGYSRDEEDIYDGAYHNRPSRGYDNRSGYRYGRADRYGSYGASRRATSGGYDTTGAGYNSYQGAGRYNDGYAPRARHDYSDIYTGSDYGRDSYQGGSSVYDEDDYDSNYGYTRGYRNRTFGGRYDEYIDNPHQPDGYGRSYSHYGNSRHDPYGAYDTMDYGNEYAAGSENYDYDMRYGRSGMERDFDSRYGAPRYGRSSGGNYDSRRYNRGYNDYASSHIGSPANDYGYRPHRRAMSDY